ASLAGDVLGNARFTYGCSKTLDTYGVPPVDMGAYEFQGAPPGPDCNADGVCDLREVTGLQVLHAPSPSSGDLFAWNTHIYADTALIGARGTNSGQGAAYAFTRQGSVWGDEQALTASDGAPGDDFGNWVRVGERWATVSARNAAVGGNPGAGA